jgi:hypothetical protein
MSGCSELARLQHRRSSGLCRARFSGPEASPHRRSSADCITNTCECEFSVHTTGPFSIGSCEVSSTRIGMSLTTGSTLRPAVTETKFVVNAPA